MPSAAAPQDWLSLWWLGNPAQPQHIGQVSLVDGNRKVAMAYAPTWLQGRHAGFALSEDLPLHPGLFVPDTRDTAAGAVDDARPDRWGERVIRLIDRPPRLSLLDFLYFAGDQRFGALGLSTQANAYAPRQHGPVPGFDGLPDMEAAVRRVLANEAVPEAQRRLLQPGASFGGARPKSLIQMNGLEWVVKFGDGDEFDSPLIEHSTMRLAQHCGVVTAATMALPVAGRHAVAVQRFGRTYGGTAGHQRLHALSAHVALRASGDTLGYPELAQLLRRVARPEAIKAEQMQLFRRMVFNILMDNTDDHEKNHVLLRAADGSYALSPAFDVLPAAQGLRYQQMRVGENGAESTLENALSEASAFGLNAAQAQGIVVDLCRRIHGWKAFFTAQGVSARDTEALAQFIDGDYLRLQREAHL